jgi:hypothetical protein
MLSPRMTTVFLEALVASAALADNATRKPRSRAALARMNILPDP